jgi:hypothetical protein
MPKISKLSIVKEVREGYPGKIVYANFFVDGLPLTNIKEIHDNDFVSCLGWGPEEFQRNQINRLLLETEPDF